MKILSFNTISLFVLLTPNKYWLLFCILLAFYFASIFPSILYSQTDTSQINKQELQNIKIKPSTQDTIYKEKHIDTSSAVSNEIIPDSVKLHIPLERHGSILLIEKPYFEIIDKKDLEYINYTGFFDILKAKLPAYPLSLGSYGNYNHISIFGGMPRDISFQFNGRPYMDLGYGSLNPEQIAPEFMERAEILTGSDAVIFSDNSSGALINIQEIKYNTKNPYTRLWYSQGGYDFLSADGIFSQNFEPNWNFTFGFRGMSSGERFANSSLEAWNIRGIMRWNPSDRTSISLVEYFTNHGYGANGGIDIQNSSSIYDVLTAVPVYQYYNQRVYRHDLTLSISSLLSTDSSQSINASLYFSHADWHEYRSSDIFVNEADSNRFMKHIERYFGATAKYEAKFLNFIDLCAGGTAQYDNMEKTKYLDSLDGLSLAAFARGAIILSDIFKLSGGLRFSLRGDRTAKSMGIKLIVNLLDNLLLSGDLSLSERMPSPAEGLNLQNENIFLALIEGKLKLDENNINLGLFLRNTDNPIISAPAYNSQRKIVSSNSLNLDKSSSLGAYISFETFLFNHVGISLNAQAYVNKLSGETIKTLPQFYFTGRSYYEIHAGRSVMRLGAAFGFIGEKQGLSFIPQTRSYYSTDYLSNISACGLDIFAEAKLGDAFVRITYNNILSNGFYYVAFYPELDRNLRLSVSWAFVD